MRLNLDKQDFEAVAAAIGKAEEQTSVEFFAVLAERSDKYHYVAGYFIALWLFVAGLFYALVAQYYWIDTPVVTFVTLQLILFLVLNGIVRFRPGLAIKFVPKSIRFRRAHANAVQQFLAHGISGTAARNGVLIFVSMAEHHAEILADRGVAEKTDQSFWDDAVAKLVAHAKTGDIAAGYSSTIDLLAEQLAPLFPPGADKSKGLDDKLVLLPSD